MLENNQNQLESFLEEVVQTLRRLIISTKKTKVTTLASPNNHGLKAKDIINQANWDLFANKIATINGDTQLSINNDNVEIRLNAVTTEIPNCNIKVACYPNESGSLLEFTVVYR